MILPDYGELIVNGQVFELWNRERAGAYASQAQMKGVNVPHGGTTINELCDLPPYSTPARDDIWWAEGAAAATTGLIPLRIVGLDGPTTSQTVDRSIDGRASIGCVVTDPRVITIEGTIVGLTCCAVQAWKRQVNDLVTACLSCDGMELRMLACAPETIEQCNGPDIEVPAQWWTLCDVALSDGLRTVTQGSRAGTGCNRCGGRTIEKVRLTLQAADPNYYLDPVYSPQVVAESTPETITCNIAELAELVCCEPEVFTVEKPKEAKPVRVQLDGSLCPIGWDYEDFERRSCYLYIAEIEPAPPCKPYAIDLVYDGSWTWSAASSTQGWPDDSTIPCSCSVEVASLRVRNPNYQPLCEGCYRNAENIQCAIESGLTVGPIGFLVPPSTLSPMLGTCSATPNFPATSVSSVPKVFPYTGYGPSDPLSALCTNTNLPGWTSTQPMILNQITPGSCVGGLELADDDIGSCPQAWNNTSVTSGTVGVTNTPIAVSNADTVTVTMDVYNYSPVVYLVDAAGNPKPVVTSSTTNSPTVQNGFGGVSSNAVGDVEFEMSITWDVSGGPCWLQMVGWFEDNCVNNVRVSCTPLVTDPGGGVPGGGVGPFASNPQYLAYAKCLGLVIEGGLTPDKSGIVSVDDDGCMQILTFPQGARHLTINSDGFVIGTVDQMLQYGYNTGAFKPSDTVTVDEFGAYTITTPDPDDDDPTGCLPNSVSSGAPIEPAFQVLPNTPSSCQPLRKDRCAEPEGNCAEFISIELEAAEPGRPCWGLELSPNGFVFDVDDLGIRYDGIPPVGYIDPRTSTMCPGGCTDGLTECEIRVVNLGDGFAWVAEDTDGTFDPSQVGFAPNCDVTLTASAVSLPLITPGVYYEEEEFPGSCRGADCDPQSCVAPICEAANPSILPSNPAPCQPCSLFLIQGSQFEVIDEVAPPRQVGLPKLTISAGSEDLGGFEMWVYCDQKPCSTHRGVDPKPSSVGQTLTIPTYETVSVLDVYESDPDDLTACLTCAAVGFRNIPAGTFIEFCAKSRSAKLACPDGLFDATEMMYDPRGGSFSWAGWDIPGGCPIVVEYRYDGRKIGFDGFSGTAASWQLCIQPRCVG